MTKRAFILLVAMLGMIPGSWSRGLESPPAKARLHLLSIGVQKFQDPRIRPLRFAVADARAVAGLFKDRDYLPLPAGVQVELYDEEATVAKARAALEKIGTEARPADTVVIFVSSHGMALGNGRAAWIFHDSRLDETEYEKHNALPEISTVLSQPDVAGLLERIVAKRVVLMVDSCFSGGSVVHWVSKRGTKDITFEPTAPPLEKDPFHQVQGEGRVILTATTGAELACETTSLQHGAFTYYLLEALRGQADGIQRKDNIVEVMEAWTYLQDKVKEASRDSGCDQNPTISTVALTHGFPLTTYPLVPAASPAPASAVLAAAPETRGGIRETLNRYVEALDVRLALEGNPGATASARYRDLGHTEARLAELLYAEVRPADGIARLVSDELSRLLDERQVPPRQALSTLVSKGLPWPAGIPDPRDRELTARALTEPDERYEPPLPAAVAGDGAVLRSGRRHDAAATRSLPAGERIVLTERHGEWYRVNLPGPEGGASFVHGSLVEPDLAGHASMVPRDVPSGYSRVHDVRPTYYFTAREEGFPSRGPYGPNHYDGNERRTLLEMDGDRIADTSARYFDSLCMEGSGILRDGRAVNWAGNRRFEVLPAGCKGDTATGNWVVPFHTLAVNPREMTYEEVYFVPRSKGIELPDGTMHDGYWFAHDTGGAFQGVPRHRIDMYVDQEDWVGWMERQFVPSKSTPVEIYRVDDPTIRREVYQRYGGLLGRGGPPPPPVPTVTPDPAAASLVSSLDWVRVTSPSMRPLEVLATEVTNGQFASFLGSRPEWRRDRIDPAMQDGDYLVDWPSPASCRPGTEDLPVRGVSWFAAKAFANWMGGRLPTEAEWTVIAGGEAARTIYPWGDSWSEDRGVASGSVQPVRSHPRGGAYWGGSLVHHIAGNVWEWCDDAVFDQELTPGSDELAARVIKGGSVLSGPMGCMISASVIASPRLCAEDGGIRVVREP